MAGSGKPDNSRKRTDGSLRRERKKTDRALELKLKITENLADGVVEHAREQADGVLNAARERADEKLNPDRPGGAEPHALAQERAEEDVALKQERAAADDTLRWEREEQSRILAALLPHEGEKTDRYLLTEREFSDEAIENRDTFLGIVSHDLRNLLAGVALAAKVRATQASDSDEGRRTLVGTDRIERYLARMNRLIGDLVDVAAIDAGKLAVHPLPGDVGEMIAEAVTTFSDAARSKGISLAFVPRGQVPPAVFDRGRKMQVLANLISNAMRFTHSGGSITIEAAHLGNELRVSVIDTGEGIPEELREAIFERFGQACGNHHGGLGLGLYISRSIIEAQGGRIWAERNPGGSGAAIHFTISVRDGVGPLRPTEVVREPLRPPQQLPRASALVRP